MLMTDLQATVNGITANCSFSNYKALHAYMCKNNIEKCNVFATVASIQITEPVEVTRTDIEKMSDL